ncbi:MAG: cyclic nucleotide-binding domain-containing protein [Chitinivibrionales bacterium]|nr:cyclic nucleotide-binding domain-containing protein [Chitinivibrionales bacterium]MBD3397084.1 cyclic nucleotide-binding domain-containing protein [Chitinivibrionales bacterium]
MAANEPKTELDKKVLEYQPGDVVMEQGQVAKGLYILMSGTLEVVFDNVKVAEIDQKGSFVGEIASLLGGRRTATVRAATPVKMLYVQRVTEYLVENSKAALMIAQTLASRITALNKKFSHFEQVAKNWIEVAKDAVETQDVTPIKNALDEMQRVFVNEVRAR